LSYVFDSTEPQRTSIDASVLFDAYWVGRFSVGSKVGRFLLITRPRRSRRPSITVTYFFTHAFTLRRSSAYTAFSFNEPTDSFPTGLFALPFDLSSEMIETFPFAFFYLPSYSLGGGLFIYFHAGGFTLAQGLSEARFWPP